MCVCVCIRVLVYIVRTRELKQQSEDISEVRTYHTSTGLSVKTEVEGWVGIRLSSSRTILCVCVFESDSVRMCFGLCVHPERMAPCQMQADNILRETLQCCILTSNCSNVYSNQRHNRWRGMNLWQAGWSHSSFTCGFWCLMTASQKELNHLSVSRIKEVLSAAVNVLSAYMCWNACSHITEVSFAQKKSLLHIIIVMAALFVLALYTPIMRPMKMWNWVIVWVI